MPNHGFFIKPLKVKLLAGEQKATEKCGLVGSVAICRGVSCLVGDMVVKHGLLEPHCIQSNLVIGVAYVCVSDEGAMII